MQTQTQQKPVGVKLSPEIKVRLQKIGTIKDRSTHWLMREAIDQYVQREEASQIFKQETLEAWEEYQKDGLHITQNEMIKWLSSWGTPDESGCPPCHK